MLLVLIRPMEESWNFGNVVVVAEYICVWSGMNFVTWDGFIRLVAIC